MNEKQLRNSLIKIAYENPESRDALVPLIKKSLTKSASNVSGEVVRMAGSTGIRISYQPNFTVYESGVPVDNVKETSEHFKIAAMAFGKRHFPDRILASADNNVVFVNVRDLSLKFILEIENPTEEDVEFVENNLKV